MLLQIAKNGLIYNTLLIFGGLSIICVLTIFPIIFNYFIIPNLEKRIGQKLKFNPNYFGPLWPAKNLELGIGVTRILLFKLFHKYPTKFTNTFVVDRVNYNTTTAPKFELIMCVLVATNAILFLVSAALITISS